MIDESRPSHFDAWHLGDDPSRKRKARIENLTDLARVRSLVGERNFEGARNSIKFLAHYGLRPSLWIFLTEEEIRNDPHLREKEKSICLEMLQEFKQDGYVAWFGGQSGLSLGNTYLKEPMRSYTFFWKYSHLLSHNRYDWSGFQGPSASRETGGGSGDSPGSHRH